MWTQAELTAIGKIVVNFSALDHCTNQILKGFLSPDPAATLLVAGESLSWKLEKLEAITAEAAMETALRQSLCDWIAAIKLVNARRNNIMHSLWTIDGTTRTMVRMKAGTRGGHWKAHQESVGLRELNDLVDLLFLGIGDARRLSIELKRTGIWNGSILNLNSPSQP